MKKQKTMANILVIDDQEWVMNLCKKAVSGQEHHILLTNDIECVGDNVASFKPDIVLLNLYLKHGFLVWDVLVKLKAQNPNLPVLIVTEYDNFLFEPLLSQADGYVIRNPEAPDELRQKISILLRNSSVVYEDLVLATEQPNSNETKQSCKISRRIITNTDSNRTILQKRTTLNQ